MEKFDFLCKIGLNGLILFLDLLAGEVYEVMETLQYLLLFRGGILS